MTAAPVGAVDHAGALARAEDVVLRWKRSGEKEPSPYANLGRAYLDLDRRREELENALARVIDEADEFITTQTDPMPWHHAFLRIRDICGAALSDADAAHGAQA